MEIGVLDAKNRLSELLDRAAGGEEIVITKRGKPIVRLSPVVKEKTQEEWDALFERVRQRREALPFKTTWEELKRDRDEGRKY